MSDVYTRCDLNVVNCSKILFSVTNIYAMKNWCLNVVHCCEKNWVRFVFIIHVQKIIMVCMFMCWTLTSHNFMYKYLMNLEWKVFE